MNTSDNFDLLVIGGGINGTGVAALAAASGYRVALCDQSDLASGTSSASSKMIHGGLRYLEQGRIGLVAESLHERAALQTLCPHLVRPLPLVMPVGDGGRPLWMLRIGVMAYDWLSRKGHLPRSGVIEIGEQFPLRPDYRRGIRYWDCQVDDARLVVTNALAAQRDGACILNYSKCTAARPHEGGWTVTMSGRNGDVRELRCKILINAAGPWVNIVEDGLMPGADTPRVRLVKGSHLVLNRTYPGEDAFLLQHVDGRVIFAIPWLDKYTLLGTTDVDYAGDPAEVAIDDNEIGYLKAVYQDYFGRSLTDKDIAGSFAGVRALVDDGAVDPRKASRESKVDACFHSGSPVVSLYGGKLTTYRALAQQCLKKVAHILPAPHSADVLRPFPGGDIESLTQLRKDLIAAHDWLPRSLLLRYSASYGSRAYDMLEGCASLTDLGGDFGHELYEKEVNWLLQTEWARTADDILWRRSKLGMCFSAAETAALESYLAKRDAG